MRCSEDELKGLHAPDELRTAFDGSAAGAAHLYREYAITHLDTRLGGGTAGGAEANDELLGDLVLREFDAEHLLAVARDGVRAHFEVLRRREPRREAKARAKSRKVTGERVKAKGEPWLS